MVAKSSVSRKILVVMMVFAVMLTYSVMPMNQAFAASKRPAQVKKLKAKANSDSAIQLTWKKAKSAKKYQVYAAEKKKGKYKKVATLKAKKKSYTVTKVNKKVLKPGKSYFFKVRAINGKKKGKFSKVVSAKTLASVPATTPEKKEMKPIYDMTAEEWAAVGVTVDKLDFKNDFFLNVRAASAYEEKHIAGAVNVPVGREPAASGSDVAKALDKAYADANGRRIVIVCNSGQGLAKSAMEYFRTSGKDMDNVTYLIGGATKYNEIDPDNLVFDIQYNYIIAENLFNSIKAGNSEYKVIDVRLIEDNTGTNLGTYGDAHLVTAVSAPVHDDKNKPLPFKEAIENLKDAGVTAEGSQKYAIICYYGGGLAERAYKLAYSNMGVSSDRLYILENGMWSMDPEWSFMADHPYEIPEYFVSTSKSNGGVAYNGVTAANLKKDIEGSHKLFKIVDVRNSGDYETGHIPTAVSAPVADDSTAAANIKSVFDQYGKNAVYCLICYSGNAYADKGQELLKKNGVPEENIVRLIGGQASWSD